MKLYTENDLKRAIKRAYLGSMTPFSLLQVRTEILENLTPIKLPSDEEIEEKLNVAYGNGYEQGEMDFYKKMQCKGDKYADGYSEGYKRALDLVKYKIDNDLQGGNNERQ